MRKEKYLQLRSYIIKLTIIHCHSQGSSTLGRINQRTKWARMSWSAFQVFYGDTDFHEVLLRMWFMFWLIVLAGSTKCRGFFLSLSVMISLPPLVKKGMIEDPCWVYLFHLLTYVLIAIGPLP